MVSKLNLIIAGGAIVAFIALGGASGIGSRIGGGFKDFGDSIISGIKGIGQLPDLFPLPTIENVPDLSIQPTGSRPETDESGKRAFRIGFASGASLERSFEASAPLGFAKNIAGVRGKPLAPTAISRSQPTFTGVLTTRQGSRAIAGSEALFRRLESNLRTSSNRTVSQASLNTAVNTGRGRR